MSPDVSEAMIDHVIATSEALIAAFDAQDIEAIETALPAFASSVEALKSPGVWQQAPGISTRVAEALEIVNKARTLALCRTDNTRRQIDLLATAAGRFDATPAVYGRPGR